MKPLKRTIRFVLWIKSNHTFNNKNYLPLLTMTWLPHRFGVINNFNIDSSITTWCGFVILWFSDTYVCLYRCVMFNEYVIIQLIIIFIKTAKHFATCVEQSKSRINLLLRLVSKRWLYSNSNNCIHHVYACVENSFN